MNRRASLTVRTSTDHREQKLPPSLSSLFRERLQLPSYFSYSFSVPESDWCRLNELRRFLRQEWEEEIDETWQCDFSRNDKRNASLLWFTPQFDGEVVEHNESVSIREICEVCGGARWKLSEAPQLDLTIPSFEYPCVFSSPESLLLVMTRRFYDALGDAGLQRGLSTIPVNVISGPDDEFVALRATQSVGWPAAPYGLKRIPCTTCGNVKNASPLYAFYWTFDKPEELGDWYYWPIHGRGTPLLSIRAHSWIRQNVVEYSQGPVPDDWFNDRMFGWFPDNKDSAFLPEAYHDPVLTAKAVHWSNGWLTST